MAKDDEVSKRQKNNNSNDQDNKVNKKKEYVNKKKNYKKDYDNKRKNNRNDNDNKRKNNRNDYDNKRNNNQNDNDNKRDNKKDHKKHNGISTHHVYGRNKKLEIQFDPQARREYLTGASQRKKDRRIYGLAMQKLKDRKARVEGRREEAEARKEQVEEAERQKNHALFGHDNENDDADDKDSTEEAQEPPKKKKLPNTEDGEHNIVTDKTKKTTATFQDEETRSQFGGNIIVTTIFGIPDDDDGEDEVWKQKMKKINVDTEQRYNNNVQKYINQVKGNLPNNKKKSQANPHMANKKGMHGAQGMKGMGSGQDLKMAQKTLNNCREKPQKGQRTGGKRKKR